jgi:hypothetical protein
MPYGPEIPLPGIYRKKCKSGYRQGTYPPIFIAALFPITKLWKQTRYSTTDKWIKKMWYLYAMEFYSVIKKNEILLIAGKWVKQENYILSKVNQVQKVKGSMYSLICEIQAKYKASNIIQNRSC